MAGPIASSLPLEPRRRETPEEHRARMEAKRAEAHRFEDLDRAAAAARVVKPKARDTRARAIEAYQFGEGVKAVAARFGIGPATLQTWLEEDGVRLRDAAAAAQVARRPAVEPVPAAPQAVVAEAAPSAPVPAPVARPVPRPPAARTPTADEQARLAAVTAYVAGDSIETIARRLGRAPSRVHRWLQAAGVQMRPWGATRAEFDVEQAVAQYAEGATLAELAAVHHVAANTISRRLREHGVELRRGGRRPAAAAPDPAPSLPPAAPSAPAPLSTPPPTAPDKQPALPVEAPAPPPPLAVRLPADRTPASAPDVDQALAAVVDGVTDVLATIDELSDRWAVLQISRDYDAGAALARMRVAAEQLRALATPAALERTAS